MLTLSPDVLSPRRASPEVPGRRDISHNSRCLFGAEHFLKFRKKPPTHPASPSHRGQEPGRSPAHPPGWSASIPSRLCQEHSHTPDARDRGTANSPVSAQDTFQGQGRAWEGSQVPATHSVFAVSSSWPCVPLPDATGWAGASHPSAIESPDLHPAVTFSFRNYLSRGCFVGPAGESPGPCAQQSL
uniref:Uncharacterized protein n=1 Tax=Pipistrellus kuhlii TaxID=59472 RepID=A0A7J7QVA2_PIPKU|nr:hypothetical protein mPipKuh1_008342 [Pipistrellus kuhlii]